MFFLILKGFDFSYFFSRDSLTDAFGDKDNGDYRKSPAPEDDMLSAGGAHQRPSGELIFRDYNIIVYINSRLYSAYIQKYNHDKLYYLPDPWRTQCRSRRSPPGSRMDDR